MQSLRLEGPSLVSDVTIYYFRRHHQRSYLDRLREGIHSVQIVEPVVLLEHRQEKSVPHSHIEKTHLPKRFPEPLSKEFDLQEVLLSLVLTSLFSPECLEGTDVRYIIGISLPRLILARIYYLRLFLYPLRS